MLYRDQIGEELASFHDVFGVGRNVTFSPFRHRWPDETMEIKLNHDEKDTLKIRFQLDLTRFVKFGGPIRPYNKARKGEDLTRGVVSACESCGYRVSRVLSVARKDGCKCARRFRSGAVSPRVALSVATGWARAWRSLTVVPGELGVWAPARCWGGCPTRHPWSDTVEFVEASPGSSL